jgi:hypothetical protein
MKSAKRLIATIAFAVLLLPCHQAISQTTQDILASYMQTPVYKLKEHTEKYGHDLGKIERVQFLVRCDLSISFVEQPVGDPTEEYRKQRRAIANQLIDFAAPRMNLENAIGWSDANAATAKKVSAKLRNLATQRGASPSDSWDPSPIVPARVVPNRPGGSTTSGSSTASKPNQSVGRWAVDRPMREMKILRDRSG